MDSIKVTVSKDEKKPAQKESPKKKRSSDEQSAGKKGGFLGKLMIAIIITAIIAAGGSYLFTDRTAQGEIEKTKAETSNLKTMLQNQISELQNKVSDIETENSTLKNANEQLKSLAGMLDLAEREFESAELGIKFEYPASYGEVKWTIEKGETGKIFTATFSGNDKLVLGGITEDYSAGRGGTFTDTRGYVKSGGKYYYLTVNSKKPTDYPLEPVKILKNEKNDVLVVDKNSFVSERGTTTPVFNPGDNSLGVLINLKGKEFAGLAFWNKDAQNIPQEKLEKIINSIVIK